MRQLIVATVLIGLLAGLAAVLPSPAEAFCTQVIYAERTASNGVITQVLGRVSSTALILWFANTTDPEFARIIAAAVAQRNRLQVTAGTPASICPAAPATGLRDIGAGVGPIVSLLQQP